LCSGIDNCPPVARTFPLLSDYEWKRFKAAIPAAARLKSTYRDWLKSCPDEVLGSTEPLKPLVLIEVRFDDFVQWIKKPKARWRFSDIGKFSSEVFHHRAISLLKEAKEEEQTRVVPLDYIHLVVTEIGNDKANDFASIYFVSKVPGFERKEPRVENVRLFFEYGMAVAAAYAIKNKVNAILFTKVRIR
ncbi:MAG TPA: hypothetical protein DCE44_20235, partial [Verrucomicrobiales bacterium]|nr:hypothetical protein [Verrucomicrobiales bacterium]